MSRRGSCHEAHEARGNPALGPDVGPDLPARDLTVGNPVHFNRVALGPAAAATLDFVDQRNTEGELALACHLAKEEPLRGGKSTWEGHGLNLDMMSNLVNPCRIGLFVPCWDDIPMPTNYEDIYPKRSLFREWVADAKAKLGATNNAAVAPIMDYSPSTLNKMLGKSPTHKPSSEALKLLGDFLDRDYRLLLDGPGAAPPGISDEAWAEASKKDRVIANAMIEDLKSIPEEEKEAYYNLWKQGVMIGRA